ncbi:MAG: 50S ribosomal protein L24 [Candidatus Aenigmatarchaeota archaeon]
MKRPRSKKARKQRKFLFSAPLHVRRKMISAHLSKELREKYKRRSFPLRKGDEVEIMKGEFKGKRGKVSRVDLKKYKVYIEGITRKKTTGAEVQVPIHPSNLKIINLNLDDKKRVEALERKIR